MEEWHSFDIGSIPIHPTNLRENKKHILYLDINSFQYFSRHFIPSWFVMVAMQALNLRAHVRFMQREPIYSVICVVMPDGMASSNKGWLKYEFNSPNNTNFMPN